MRSRIRPQRRVPIALGLLVAQFALVLLDLHSAIILAPAALWLAVLFAGFRPGEKLVERIAENRRRRLARRPARSFRPRRESAHVATLAHRLIAIDLAMRPPPSPSLV